MLDHPILFSGAMVRRILDGSKTVTRRVIKRENAPDHGNVWQDCDCHDIDPSDTPCEVCVARFGPSPYGDAGDRLWVRECWAPVQYNAEASTPSEMDASSERPAFRATFAHAPAYRWRPSIHMPRWASRLTLDVVSVRAERLHDITNEDAILEGVRRFDNIPVARGYSDPANPPRWTWQEAPPDTSHCLITARHAFSNLWESINSELAPWASNPWVWRVEFKQVQP